MRQSDVVNQERYRILIDIVGRFRDCIYRFVAISLSSGTCKVSK